MVGYVLMGVISLFVLIGTIFIYKKIKKKYRSLLKKIMSFCLVLVSISGVNLSFNNFTRNLANDSDLEQIDADISSLNKEIAEENDKINELNSLSKVLSDEEIKNYNNEYTKIKEELDNNTQELNALISEYNSLNKEYQTLYNETSHLIEGVITYHQYPLYPNGCESVALYILLKYYDVDVTVEEIVEALPKGSSPYRVGGVLYAGNPLREFVGDPRLYTGYGVFEEPIIEVANQFKEGIINYTGHSLDDVLALVKKGHPVQVWASINMEDTDVCVSWIDEDTGENVDWICDLHSLVVIGYDYKSVITSDSYTGKIETYNREQFEAMYNLFGKRALYYEE